MPISTTDQLFNLIKSLSKAEKRNFKLYAKRTQQSSEARFIRLFDVLDKMELYNESVIFKRFHSLSKGQLSNLKRHLYSQILSSLRVIHIQKNIDIQIREQIDFARILYGKGLYMQSLKLLNRIKGIAMDANQDVLHYEILEFEKLIEEKHITRSRTVKNKMENLIQESELRDQILSNACKLTNLKLEIHGLYIKMGHAKNEEDARIVQDYFEKNLPKLDYKTLTFFEKVYLHQTYVWYYYILLDFEQCFEHARKWTDMFHQTDSMISKDPDLYLRGLHYMLTSMFALRDRNRHENVLKLIEKLYEEHAEIFNMTTEIIHFLYYYSALLNRYFLTGTFEEGLAIIKPLEEKLEAYDRHLDLHRILVFYYRIAWLLFGCGKFGEAIDYLNKIINLKAGHLREDIQSYARLLNLLAHYELGNYELLEYLEKSVGRFYGKMENQNRVQMEVLSFIRKKMKSNPSESRSLLEALKESLEKLEQDRFEKRSFIYLDAMAWVESKLEGVLIQDIITARHEAI